MNGMPTVAVITSVMDNYDVLRRHAEQFGVTTEWICVTDGLDDAHAEPGHGWRIVTEERGDEHPNRAAKGAKLFPWQYTAAPYSIWIDGSYRVISNLFAVQVLKSVQGTSPIAQFVHPWRQCIYREAAVSRELERYRDQYAIISKQFAEYEEIGHPADWGLWATGVIVRRHTQDVRAMSAQWMREINRWSYQDQISEPVALRLTGLRPVPLPGDHITNPWLKYEGSERHG